MKYKIILVTTDGQAHKHETALQKAVDKWAKDGWLLDQISSTPMAGKTYFLTTVAFCMLEDENDLLRVKRSAMPNRRTGTDDEQGPVPSPGGGTPSIPMVPHIDRPKPRPRAPSRRDPIGDPPRQPAGVPLRV